MPSGDAKFTANILVVDDRSENIDVLANILDPEYNVIAATSGEKALELIKEKVKPDLVLMDVAMPGMDGFETCRRIKSDPDTQGIDIIFVSAMDALEYIISGYEAGGRDYLTKPIVPEEISQKVRLTIDEKKHRAEIVQQQQFAMETAMMAMSNAGEQGVIIELLRNSFSVGDTEELAKFVIAAIKSYELESSFQLRACGNVIEASTNGIVTPLERNLLSKLQGAGRLREKGDFFVTNFSNVSLLVKNMPEDEDKRGRLRDHLAMLAEGVDLICNQICLKSQLAQSEAQLTQSMLLATESVKTIKNRTSISRDKIKHASEDLITQMERKFMTLGLTEEQEDELINMVTNTEHLIDREIAESLVQEEEMEKILEMSREMRWKSSR